LAYWAIVFFIARNFRILHPTHEDAASGQIWHFATMPGQNIVILITVLGDCLLWATFSAVHKSSVLFLEKNSLGYFLTIFSQKHLVTLPRTTFFYGDQ
jgi:hypothetical protein